MRRRGNNTKKDKRIREYSKRGVKRKSPGLERLRERDGENKG